MEFLFGEEGLIYWENWFWIEGWRFEEGDVE